MARNERLKEDEAHLKKVKNPYIEITKLDGNPGDMYSIRFKCKGVVDEHFNTAGSHEVILTFPDTYPFSAPQFEFKSKIFHPNVYANNDICWGPEFWDVTRRLPEIFGIPALWERLFAAMGNVD